jgi:SPP1 family predicted phage head-tail adaptor
MVNYQAGLLRTKVRLQYKKLIGAGINKVAAWPDLGNTAETDTPRYTRCYWYPLGGTETWVADATQVVDAANVVIRYNSSVTSACRLVRDGVIYSIIGPNDPDQHKHWLKFKVKAAVNGQ